MLLFLGGGALLGAGLVRRALRGAAGAAEQAAWGLVFGWMLAAVAVYALARAQGRLAFATVAWTTTGLWAVAALAWLPALRGLRTLRRAGLWRREYAGLVAVLAAFAPVYWRLFSAHMLAEGPDGVYSGGNSWFDMAFHAALASSFAHGRNFPPAYTPLPPEPLLYPFLPDFLTAALMAAGVQMRTALLATAVPLALACTAAFYTLAWRVARSRAAAVAAVCLFLLNGGLGFVELFRDWRQSGQGFLPFWNSLGENYANIWARGIHWTNLVADTLLPQRASLFGLPAALVVFTLFAVVWRRGSGGEGGRTSEGQGPEATDRRIMLAAGVLAGLLPLFHTHSYFAVGFVSVFLFLARPRRHWLYFWTPAVLLAAPHLLALARHAAGAGFVHLRPGWMWGGEESFALYLLRNFGLPLLLSVPAWLAAPRAWRVFYLPFAALFAFSLVVMVSPNVFDNIKLMHPWHALTSVLVGAWLARLAAGRWWRRAAAALLLFFCVATGVAALRRESLARSRLFSAEEVSAARYVREHTAPRALFLTAPVFNQPVLCLAGRPVVRGATSWLWSHGYEFRSREADVRRIYAGAPEAFELLAHYGVAYVYLGDAERRELRADESFFEQNFPVLYRGPGLAVYDTRRAGRADAERPRAPAPRELAPRLGRDPYVLLADFPRTSFFVYRLFKASSGRMPRREEFMSGMRRLGGGLSVGAEGWERRLEENRRALVEDWAARAEFAGAHAARADADYVDALLANAGLAPDGRRGRLIADLASGRLTRAAALFEVSEDEEFYAREYDTAYVLVHFFGYLGRNPDDPPDRDLGGLHFWRDHLAHTRDYRSLSRAFMEAVEYKERMARK
ncbi:MAG TPA: hypothetical protein VG148_16480 [Pyrinomonadaceae bacterium]|nr:hypothetical protein [Pyrinomonadaceae bacterium]